MNDVLKENLHRLLSFLKKSICVDIIDERIERESDIKRKICVDIIDERIERGAAQFF